MGVNNIVKIGHKKHFVNLTTLGQLQGSAEILHF